MATGKENEVPATARRHGVAVKRRGLKKRMCGKQWLCRVPLRDITNLIASSAAAAELDVLPWLEDPDQASELVALLRPSTAVRDAAVAGGVAAKAARYSLRKEFR